MGDFLIRNMPEALKRKLEDAAKRQGRSLSAEAIALLQESLLAGRVDDDAPFVSAWHVLRPVAYPGDDGEAEMFTAIMDEIEAERKREFGAAVPDPE